MIRTPLLTIGKGKNMATNKSNVNGKDEGNKWTKVNLNTLHVVTHLEGKDFTDYMDRFAMLAYGFKMAR